MVNLRNCLALGLMALAACRTDANGVMVEIRRAIGPDSTCLYNVANPAVPYGYYDPTIQPLNDGYLLYLAVRNNMEKRSSDTSLMDGITPVRPEGNSYQVVGVEGCWTQFDPNSTSQTAYENGLVADCNSLPGQSGSIPVSISLDDGAIEALVGVKVLTPEHLKQIFGPSFDAKRIPRLGASSTSINGAPANVFSYKTTDPNNANRDVSWGENYPKNRLASVLLQLRTVGRVQGGGLVHSGWFSYQINICPGCSQDPCGMLIQRSCIGTCAEGVCPASGVCANGSPCPVVTLFSGKQPDYNAPDVCEPWQNFGKTDCTVSVGCPSI